MTTPTCAVCNQPIADSDRYEYRPALSIYLHEACADQYTGPKPDIPRAALEAVVAELEQIERDDEGWNPRTEWEEASQSARLELLDDLINKLNSLLDTPQETSE